MPDGLTDNIRFLKNVEERLARAEVLSPSVEAERLVRHFGGMDRVDFFTGEKKLSPDTRRAVEKALRARLAGEPLSYVLKEADFYGQRFAVTPGTLIPRPETELLVEEAVRVLDRYYAPAGAPEILDLGTGTGCIAICLTLARPDCRMTALDASVEALRTARRNVDLYRLGNKVGLVRSDLFGAFEGERKGYWDLIVSNPPYVPQEDFGGLSREVLSEPRLALDGGPGGMRVIERILDEAPLYLKKKGWLLLEIGQGQAGELARRIGAGGVYANLSFIKDHAGIERVLVAQHG